jgi:endogenous inhibitor of DNA gyrase (YacG/DUF329 family)
MPAGLPTLYAQIMALSPEYWDNGSESDHVKYFCPVCGTQLVRKSNKRSPYCKKCRKYVIDLQKVDLKEFCESKVKK